MDKVLAAYPVTVPTMLVHSLWDQEDIYWAMAVWKSLKGNDPAGNLHLVIGPWYHGQEITEASALGAIKWGQDTGLWFRRKVLAPFLAQYLVDRSEEHTSELQSLMRISYAVFCLKKKKQRQTKQS